jgi:hypothetical protein
MLVSERLIIPQRFRRKAAEVHSGTVHKVFANVWSRS